MAKMRESAGVLLYRFGERGLELLLVHPGGPYWTRKDLGAWTIPKGEIDEGETPLAAARRELLEETGLVAEPPFIELTPVRQKAGKRVHAFAARGDCDPATVTSNRFVLEWPPRSGRMQEFPEVDRAAWFTPEEARVKANPAHCAFFDELASHLAAEAEPAAGKHG
jgi:predicted NUDIX family NTP pyrophosphohydrolase